VGRLDQLDHHLARRRHLYRPRQRGLWLGQASTAITPTIGAGVFISTSTGAYLSSGGTWTNASDRNLKANLAPVDGGRSWPPGRGAGGHLELYLAGPLCPPHWPDGQDFYAAFGLGEDDTHISTVDADGVALAAIQGLYAENQALKAENSAQQAQIDALAARLDALEQAHPAGRPALPASWLFGAWSRLAACRSPRPPAWSSSGAAQEASDEPQVDRTCRSPHLCDDPASRGPGGCAAVAQSGGPFDLTWHTVDGGAGTFSTSGGYSLGGTIGQPTPACSPAAPLAWPVASGLAAPTRSIAYTCRSSCGF